MSLLHQMKYKLPKGSKIERKMPNGDWILMTTTRNAYYTPRELKPSKYANHYLINVPVEHGLIRVSVAQLIEYSNFKDLLEYEQ
jgi:hypothetical protein